jgi:hypothetical protein
MMKATLLLLLLFSTATLVCAQTDAARQFNESVTRNDAAVAAALNPLRQRHVEELKVILANATRTGDLDTAVKAKELLGRYGVKVGSGGSPTFTTTSDLEAFKAQINDTVWELTSNKVQRITLKSDGELKASWHNRRRQWKVTRVGRVEAVYQQNSDTVHEFIFDPALTTVNISDGLWKRVRQ